ncbi:Importin 9 [Rhizophlyctis rosea]|nr:Importin 9 [Rhizophlyctis rosea]
MDWPTPWENLFDVLLHNLKSGTPDHVHGTMRVLSEFVADNLADQHFLQVAPILIPELYRIFVADTVRIRNGSCHEPTEEGESNWKMQTYSSSVRARSLMIFREYASSLYMMEDENITSQYLEPLLPSWMEAFQKILAVTDTPADSIAIKHQVLQTIVKLMKEFSKQMTPFITTFLEPVWNHLLNLQPRYMAERVNAEDDDGEEDVDSDGHIINLDSLVYELLQFLETVQFRATKKLHIRAMFTTASKASDRRAPTDFMKQLLGVVLGYMQVTTEMQDRWAHDMNQFIQDDEEEAMTFNVRVAVDELLVALVDGPFASETVQALCIASAQLFEEGTKLRASGDKNWWKLHEAGLLALGRMSGEVCDKAEEGELRVGFDALQMVWRVILEDAQWGDFPLLQGRAIWTSSKFASVAPPDALQQCLNFAAAGLKHAGASPVVKLLILKAIRNYGDNLPSESLVPYAGDIIHGIVELAAGAGEEALIQLLETLASVVKINDEVTAQCEGLIGPLILEAWAKGATDLVMSDIITDLAKALASNQSMTSAFQERMMPAIKEALQPVNVQQAPEVTAMALDILTSLIKAAPTPCPPMYSREVFPLVIQVLLGSEESAILQNGCDTLKSLVQRDFAGIVQWNDGTNNGLHYTIQFVAKLLAPQQTESGSIFVGGLITKLIQMGGNELAPVLPDLLRAVAERLSTAQESFFIQTLVLVFAHLIHSHMETVLDFLSNLQIGGRSGLDVFLNSWCDLSKDIQGYYSIKVGITAMARLFVSGDPRLNNVAVKGDLIQTSDNPDQYTTIPFPAKAIKVLINDLVENFESSMGKAGLRSFAALGGPGVEETDTPVDSEDEEEGDWEDVEDPSSKFQFLSDALDEGDIVDIDATDWEGADADLWEDPIYQTDIKEYLVNFFKTCAAQDTNKFRAICEQYLTPTEKKRVEAIVQ